MTRTLMFWHDRRKNSPQPSRKVAARRRRRSPLRATILGAERLEDRHMLSAGSLDATFNPSGPLPGVLVADLGFVEEPEAVAVQADGKILIAGTIFPGGPVPQNFGVARFLADGQLDTTFGTGDSDGVDGLATVDFFGGSDLAFDMIVDSAGRSVVVGVARTAGGSTGIGIVRFDANGNLDTSFDTDGKNLISVPGLILEPEAVVEQSDGKLVVAGSRRTGTSSTNDFLVARFNADGSLDTAGFGSGLGYVTTDFDGALDEVYDVAVQSDGKIVVGGQARVDGTTQFGLARYNADGTLDTTFGVGGRVHTDVIGLSTSASDLIRAIAIQTDGKIVVAGQISTSTGLADAVMARYLTDGSLDTSFNASGAQPGVLRVHITTSETLHGLVIQPDGNYVAVGGTSTSGDGTLLAMRVLASTGELDTSFGSGGITLTNVVAGASVEGFRDVALQPDGKIVAGGRFGDDFLLARYESGLALAPSISGDADVDEGATYTLILSSSDPTTSQWTINWGDEIEVVSGNPTSAMHVYADDTGSSTYTISATATTNTGTFAAGNTVEVTVHNVAPTVAISGAADVDEGAVYTLNLSSSDPGDDSITSWTINWGDGSEIVTGNPASVTHTYADDTGSSTYTIIATATDEDGTFAAGNTVEVTVLNADPAADDATFNLVENSPNGTSVGTITATDPGDDSLSFSIVGGTGAGAFSIDSDTGEITVSNSALLDFETSPVLTLEVEVADGDGGFDTALVTINLVNQASISGVVFVDVNENGMYGANEPGVDGVVIQLLDEFGDPVLDSLGDAIIAITSDGGFYLFEDLDPGTYQLFEVQPTGVDDGAEELGSLGGTIIGNDRMQLTLAQTDAFDYAFAELGQQLASGDAAGIGFWQNKHGQALIAQGGTALANWLSTNFSNVFGDELVGANGGDMASFYRDQLFKQKGKKSAGPAKVDAQFMAVALATYFTSQNLAGLAAAGYGFNVTETGIGTKIVNVGTKGAAFGVANGTELTILQLLLATNALTDQPDLQPGFAEIYDTDGDGVISSSEAALRTMANDIFSSINESGGI